MCKFLYKLRLGQTIKNKLVKNSQNLSNNITKIIHVLWHCSKKPYLPNTFFKYKYNQITCLHKFWTQDIEISTWNQDFPHCLHT